MSPLERATAREIVDAIVRRVGVAEACHAIGQRVGRSISTEHELRQLVDEIDRGTL